MSEYRENLGSIISLIQNIEDNTSMSLTQYTRKCTVNSRTFIDRKLQEEPVLEPLMQCLMNLYCGLILTAVNMNAYITDTKKVRDMINIVATESLARSSDSVLRNAIVGTEGLIKTKFADDLTLNSVKDFLEDGHSNEKGEMTRVKDTETTLPSGRILNLKLGVGDQKIETNLLVQLQPTYIVSEVMQQFIALNFSPSFSTRWLQAKAGEIGTFKDLILGMDLRRARLKALKKDKSGELKDMMDRQTNALSDALLKIFQLVPQKQNIANSILIYDKMNFESEASKSHLRIKDYMSRQKFFNKTFAMILVIVDPMYNKVDMFYHGMPTQSSFTFDQLKKKATTDSSDLVQIMKSYASGMAPKF